MTKLKPNARSWTKRLGVMPPVPDDFPKTRPEAIQRGEPYFFDAHPCAKGHVDLRTTHRGECAACHRERSFKWNHTPHEPKPKLMKIRAEMRTW